jgi:hypothetical protein
MLEVYIFLQLSNHESLIIQEYVDECIFASTTGVTTHGRLFFFLKLVAFKMYHTSAYLNYFLFY